MGSMLTQMIALRHPQRVTGIILFASMYFAEGAEKLPYSTNEVNDFFESISKKELPRNQDDLIDLAVKQWVITAKSERPHDEAQIRKINQIEINRSPNYSSRMNHSYAQVTGDELMRIAEIAVPTLVIHGTEDVVIPYIHGQMLAETIKGAMLVTLNGAGHELHPQDYSTIVNHICDYFI